MLREFTVAVVLVVAVFSVSTAAFDKDDITEKQVLQLHKYWPKEDIAELGSSSTFGDNVDKDETRDGIWKLDGKRNGFWNGKRNGFWNGKRNVEEILEGEKRNGFWNGKRNSENEGEKRNGFWNGKRSFSDEDTGRYGKKSLDSAKRNGFWNGKRNFDGEGQKRNGFWNGKRNFNDDDEQDDVEKRNGFWNGKRNFDDEEEDDVEKRNGFWNGKRNVDEELNEDEKRNGFWNGKRSVTNIPNMLLYHTTESEHKCTACGPENKGQCVMYGVCCSLETGCFMLTKEADVCTSSPPVGGCGVTDTECGDGGRCVADGVCCNQGDQSCAVDPDCDVVWY